MHDLRTHLPTWAGPLRAALTVALALVIVACGSTAPSATPSATPTPSPSATPTSAPSATPAASDDVTAIYEAIEEQVVAIRGLTPKRPVERTVLDEAQLRETLTEQFDEDTPPEYVAANERLYKALGLMPADGDLRQLTLDLLTAGVAGFYRNDQDTLYVISRTGRIGGNEKITYAHEYGHALQDQTWPVFTDQDDVLDRTDWIMARQATYEGDATLLMTQWAIQHASPEDLQDVVEAGSDPNQAAVMARVPAIMRETLLFPYTTGAAFVQGQYGQGDWAAVDAMYDRMPESTEQILHPEKYEADEAPIDVKLPADLAKRLGTGWTAPLEDTFGEFQTGIWLRESGVDLAAANDAAAGWGGDRMAVLKGPNDAWAVAWKTEWDTAADAAAFEAAAETALAKAGGSARILPGEGGTTRWIVIAGDDDTLGRVSNVLGLAG